MPAIQRISDRMALADIVAFDREGRPILIVAAEERLIYPAVLDSYREVLLAIRRNIPFAILAFAEEMTIYRKHRTRSLEPVATIPTREIIRFYAPEFADRRLSKDFIAGMIEAWLRDFMSHWKSPNPPYSEVMTALGLAARLENGRSKARVRLACLPVRGDQLPPELRDWAEPGTDTILSNPPPSLRLIIPSVCFMEVLTLFEGEVKRHNRLLDSIRQQTGEVNRNLISPLIPSLANHWNQVQTETKLLFEDFRDRLFQALEILGTTADLIHPTSEILASSRSKVLIADPTDNLILASILDHSKNYPLETKIFLSENRRDFDINPEANLAIRDSGLRFFADASKCLEWHESRPVS